MIYVHNRGPRGHDRPGLAVSAKRVLDDHRGALFTRGERAGPATPKRLGAELNDRVQALQRRLGAQGAATGPSGNCTGVWSPSGSLRTKSLSGDSGRTGGSASVRIRDTRSGLNNRIFWPATQPTGCGAQM